MMMLSYARLCCRKTGSDRMNGCSLPINIYQVIALSSLVLFSLFHFDVLVKYIPNEYQTTLTAVSILLLAVEIVSLLACTLCDPADPALLSDQRSLYCKSKEVFDRAKQGHVITASGYCQICATTVDSTSRHCAQCNKCVLRFDHHCDYINNCVGVKNYRSYIALVLSALVYSVCIVCTIVYVLYKLHSDPELLLQQLGFTHYTLFVEVPLEALLITLWMLLLLGLVALMLIANLARLHIYLIIRGWTTWDYYCRPPADRKHHSYWKQKKPTNLMAYSVEGPECVKSVTQPTPDTIPTTIQAGEGSCNVIGLRANMTRLCTITAGVCARQNRTQPISDPEL